MRAYVGVEPVSGKHKYATRTFRGGKREAAEALARMVTEVGGGSHAAYDATVADLIRRSTLRGDRRIVRSDVLPALGDVKLARPRTAQLDRFYAELRDNGGKDASRLVPATVRQTHAMLRHALQQWDALGMDLDKPSSPRVPTSRTKPPGRAIGTG